MNTYQRGIKTTHCTHSKGYDGQTPHTSHCLKHDCFTEYDKKMNSLLTDSKTYKRLTTGHTPSLERKMNEILLRLQRSGSITSGLYDKLRSLMGSLPMLYRLPKVHKPEVPLRPIMSFLWSPTYQLSKHLATILTPCRELIKPQVLTSDELLVSFNVVLLRSCTSCYRSSTAQTQG